MSSISVGACISGSISTLYLEPSSGSLEASSPVNSCSQELFQTILSDSQVHPHSGPLIYTRCHSSILGATHLYSVPLIYTRCHSSILGATHSTTSQGIYQPIFTPTTHPSNSLVPTKALVLQCPALDLAVTLAKFLFVCTFSCEDTRP